jgi:hypothetical protein
MQKLLCYQVGRCKENRKSLVEIPTHPPLHCNEEDVEGFGPLKRGRSNFIKVLKSHIYIYSIYF